MYQLRWWTVALKLDWNSSILNKALEEAKPKLRTAALMYALKEADKLRTYMQVNRPWTDRTGEAKRRLNATVSQESQDIIRITLAHGVSYGYWLEVAHEKKYSIIGPTIKIEGPRVMEGFTGLMKKIMGGAK